jgi:putative oxidoreductase
MNLTRLNTVTNTVTNLETKPMPAKLTPFKIAQLVLGLIYFVFGLNGFLQFLPQPPLPESAMGFIGGLAGAGYFLPFLKGTETLMGLLLLVGRATPVALIVLAPITLNIMLFHGILTPGAQNLVLPLVMAALQAAAASQFWNLYRPLFGTGR